MAGEPTRRKPTTSASRIGTTPRRFALRDATADAHARLDRAVGAFGDLEAYRTYLAGMIRFRTATEAALGRASWPAHWHVRPALVARHLRADAGDLGLPALVVADLVPAPRDPSALLGLVYVLEGSALGARLLREEARKLGLDERCGARHLAAQAADIGGWRAFLAVLEAEEPFDLAAATRSAEATFAFALACFEDAAA